MLREIDAPAPRTARLVRALAAALVLLALAGCGIKGPLRLPPAATEVPSAPVPAAAPAPAAAPSPDASGAAPANPRQP
jgi:predicted small lipoprotein YifL